MAQKRPYRVVAHTADIALQVWGRSREDLFANAAAGMFAQITGSKGVGGAVQRSVSVEGNDMETLLVGWLNELLYLHETQREAYARFTVSFPEEGRLQGSAEGGPCKAIKRPIKAVTYHGLSVERKGDRYEATIVFDV